MSENTTTTDTTPQPITMKEELKRSAATAAVGTAAAFGTMLAIGWVASKVGDIFSKKSTTEETPQSE